MINDFVSKKRIIFIIERSNYFRIVSPLIKFFSESGINVELWHDLSAKMPKRVLESANPNWLPDFKNSDIDVKSFTEKTDLLEYCSKNTVNYILILSLSAVPYEDIVNKKMRSEWVYLPPYPDDWMLSVKNKEHLLSIDKYVIQTDYWLEKNIEIFKEISDWFTDEIENEFRKRAIIGGWPQGDQALYINSSRIHYDLGINPQKNIVLWFNFSDSTSYPWRIRLYNKYTLFDRIGFIFKNTKNPFTFFRAFFDINVSDVIKCVRKICDHNNALLVIKYRNRETLLKIEKEMCDHSFNDINHFPSINNQLISVANVCVGPFSTAARDAAAMNKPYIMHDFNKNLERPILGEKVALGIDYSKENGYLNFRPLIYYVKNLSELSKTLSESLKNWKNNEQKCNEYYEKYVGIKGVSQCDHLSKKLFKL